MTSVPRRRLSPAVTHLPRRQFLRRTLGIVLASSALGGLAQACAPAAPAVSPTTAPAKPAASPAAAAPASSPAPAAPAASPAAAAPAASPAAAPAVASPSASPSPAAKPVASAGPGDGFQPTQRGGGGLLKILFWQAPTLLSAHVGATSNNRPIARIFLEPLADHDVNGELFPILARELPSYDGGTLDRDGMWVIWRLKPGVLWHDGKPLTADDVIFTWEYVSDPAATATTRGTYAPIAKIDKVDDLAVKITFKNPTVFWRGPFVGESGTILPKHLLDGFRGDKALNAPFLTKPIGTGPYKVVEFRPSDITIGEINTAYHLPNRPFFDRVEVKGGGDAVSALRAVTQTGEYDYAPSLQVDKDVLGPAEASTIGRLIFAKGISTELLDLNWGDPWNEVDGERSSPKSKHPFFSDVRVRRAVALSINRTAIIDALVGPQADPPRYLYVNPTRFVPEGGAWEYNPARAAQLLDEAGWVKGAGGVRAKDGVRMKVLYQTTVNGLRQQIQAVMKKELEALGFEVELKAIPSDVFFATDPNNPDTSTKFSADIQEWSASLNQPDPQFFMQQFLTAQIAQASNKWTGLNRSRYSNAEFDRLFEQGGRELDPTKREEIFKSMNRLLHETVAVAPIFTRNNPAAAKKDLRLPTPHTWNSQVPNIEYWYRAR
ncbi:MAG: peptide ABC transporter substrate-binding protein [Gemmataceae bacterium]|nr:peptide ABC transporter substrate-binding protein [Gemmataceae bacterium]